MILNGTNAVFSFDYWNNTGPTSTVFSVSDDASVNGSSDTYVAYLFAHNAGGFGTAGTDNVISCGSFTTDGSGFATVSLGYEPQYLMFKRSSGTGNWFVADVMRGWNMTTDAILYANLSNAEVNTEVGNPTATGFYVEGAASSTYIYMAIRRPMKVPTTGTSVFSPVTYTGNSAAQVLTTGFAVDAEIINCRDPGAQSWQPAFVDRLRGNGRYLASSGTAVEGNYSADLPTQFQSNTAVTRTNAYFNYDGGGGAPYTFVTWTFRRASGFFDVVCYTGNGTAGRAINHNLTVAPELMIVKSRSVAGESWATYVPGPRIAFLDSTAAGSTSVATYFGDNSVTVPPTASVFTVGSNDSVNQSAGTYVAYLFATCAGVSKVGTYTGTGTTQTIACGFTAGARFVMIKRRDASGDWYVWDTARGIISGNDPYLLLNSTAAEVTNTDYVDPVSSGFELSSTAPAAINANGGSFIFLAIA
jgi:hypothetical protein